MCTLPRSVYRFFFTLIFSSFWTSRCRRCRSFSPPVLAFIFIAHRVQLSGCASIFHRVLLTHALALSASKFVHRKKSQRIYTGTHSAGLELTKMTYNTRLEDNLIRHRGDRLYNCPSRIRVCSNHTATGYITAPREYVFASTIRSA